MEGPRRARPAHRGRRGWRVGVEVVWKNWSKRTGGAKSNGSATTLGADSSGVDRSLEARRRTRQKFARQKTFDSVQQ